MKDLALKDRAEYMTNYMFDLVSEVNKNDEDNITLISMFRKNMHIKACLVGDELDIIKTFTSLCKKDDDWANIIMAVANNLITEEIKF